MTQHAWIYLINGYYIEQTLQTESDTLMKMKFLNISTSPVTMIFMHLAPTLQVILFLMKKQLNANLTLTME
uniref:Uncharacterized protein n=1 Tax=Aeromonas caviae TaxID=648 RepID=A0A7U5Y9A6_AERCA